VISRSTATKYVTGPASPDKVVTDLDDKKVVQRTSCHPTSHHASGHADDEGEDDGQVHREGLNPARESADSLSAALASCAVMRNRCGAATFLCGCR
jgi:hypothetical protein